MKNAAELFKKILEASDKPAVKITIERAGEAPIVIEDASEYIVFVKKGDISHNCYGASMCYLLHAQKQIGKIVTSNMADVLNELKMP